ncbi:hypothetical protein CDD81_7269 [Ophiocordyceps australis]|uniref:ARID domain-containing protein n=1 Tax=Ophiocordyceps australis TaxID=1399860 RepID=A0A2C5Y5X5_9HYPO|nr:hypothetical protein CDD81_7269 [Ophiocordyceps australis]
MTTSPQEVPMHTIDRTPQYEEFMTQLRDYHVKRGTTLDPEPKVGMTHLDLFKVFNHIVANGGYDKVSEEKLAWRRMAAELGIHSNNEASTAFALKEKFYKNLAAFEISTVHKREPPPKEILEDVTAKGASLLTRTRENFRGKRESNMNATDSAASGDDGTPTRERPAAESQTSSARASRGLREAPPQRVIFQPDTGPGRATRQTNSNASTTAATSATPSQQPPATSQQSSRITSAPPAAHPPHHNIQHHQQPTTMQPMSHGLPNYAGRGGPAIVHRPINGQNMSPMVLAYQPKHMKPLHARPVGAPGNTPNELQKQRLSHRPAMYDPASRQPMLPGTGFDGPNIYTRCLNSLRSSVVAEQSFALNHLVKISFERGDKFRFDAFPALAEGLVEKALQVGSLFYDVNWTVVWDMSLEWADIGCLDGNDGTPDILERIESLVEKDVPEQLQTAEFADQLTLVTEATLTMRNMVTLPENAHSMSDFCPLKDLLCIILQLPPKDSVTEMKHLALDIAEQLTPYMSLDADDALYKSLVAQLASEDRGTILTALRAIGRISMNLEATNKLEGVSTATLQRIVNWLLLNDDELTDACLDFLYQYTAVPSNLDNLFRTASPDGLVDHLVRLLAHAAHTNVWETVLRSEQRMPSRNEIAPVPEDLLQELIKLDEPDRVHQWVRCFFDEDEHSFITQLAAWQAYQSAFVQATKAVGKPMISPADFIRNSTSVYARTTAQVLRERGEPQQKFIIHGIRARPRPLNRRNEKCGQFYLRAEQMWNHIMTVHLGETRSAKADGKDDEGKEEPRSQAADKDQAKSDKKQDDEGMGQEKTDGEPKSNNGASDCPAAKFANVERELQCTWGDCCKYAKPTRIRLRDFALHVNTHIMAMLPGTDSVRLKATHPPWLIPALHRRIRHEETARDERPVQMGLGWDKVQAAGIPVSAVLVLRNIARNAAKTEAGEEEQQRSGAKMSLCERLFWPQRPRLFEILTENKYMRPHVSSLLEIICTESDPNQGD